MLSLPPKKKMLSILAKNPWKQKLNFSRSALFQMKTRVFLKYFVRSCSSRPFYDFQKMLISWRQFVCGSWWLTILSATINTFKRMKNLKLIIITCWVNRTGWKLKKGLDLGPSLQNQHEKELGMSVVSYTNVSPSFILILNRIQKKH